MKPNDDAARLPDLASIARQREAVAVLETKAAAAAADLRRATGERARLVRAGHRQSEIADADRRIARLSEAHEAAGKALTKAAADLIAHRGRLVKEKSPDTLLATLAGTHPVAMLPVRLETRFFNAGNELRIRIFPDQVHLDQHDPALTIDEQAAADWYWTEREQSGDQSPAAGAAWNELARRFGARRAAWIVEAGQPGGSAALRGGARAAAAVALPDRWLVVGYTRGREQFRKWSTHTVPGRLAVGLAMDAAGGNAAAPAPDAVPLPQELKWLSDYAAAEAQGMAITITQADVIAGRTALAGGVDRLVVLGVDWTLTPAEAADLVEQLLESHLYADGLSVVPQGTPTNNTTSSPAGDDPSVAAALDPLGPSSSATSTPASTAFARLLGVHDSQALRRIPGGSCREQQTAQHLLSALWPSTLGAYLALMLDPLVDSATQQAIRDHAVAYLRPNGFAPTLRIGRQPYGVIPVIPSAGFEGSDAFETRIAQVLADIRQPWSLVGTRVPRVTAGPGLDDPNGTIESRMKRLLHQAPVSAALRFRRVLSPTTAANGSLPNEVKDVQERLMLLLISHFGWSRRPFISKLVAEPAQYPLPVAFVQATRPGPAPLSPNYIADIVSLIGKPSPRAALDQRLANLENGDTLLQSFLALSAVQAIDAGTLVVLGTRAGDGEIDKATLRSGHFRVDETVHVKKARATPDGAVAVSTPGEAADVVIADIDRQRTVADLVAAAMRDDRVKQRLPEDATKALEALVRDLEYLSGRNADELDWSFRGVLDCMSYRLDAWISSLAHRRIHELRAMPGRAHGVHVGGYGWVEDLKPDAAQADSLGYVLAPSLPHAATAAILRSASQVHADSGSTPFDVDLRSDRVALALDILDGVARGQPIVALIGYRLERALQTRDPRLARFILPIRTVAPLRPVRPGTPPPPGLAEAIAARDVADGVALIERLRDDRARLLADIQAAATSSPQQAQAVTALMPAVARELDALADLMDAVSDVLVTESVYQTVIGNPERAAAALGVLDRQTRPLEPQAIDTPRSGHVYTQRAAVLTLESLPPEGGGALTDPVLQAWEPFSTDARAAAEPRVNAWIARLLGDPSRYRFAADLISRADDGSEGREALEPVSLDALGLSPLMVLASAASGTQSGPSELHRRLVSAFLAGRAAAGADTVIELSRDAATDVAGSIGLGALEALLALIQKLIGRVRPLDNRDFAPPSSVPATAIAAADLAGRADALVARIRTATVPLTNALAADPVALASVRDALASLSAAGVMGALPVVLDAAGVAPGSEPELRLLDQARDLHASLSGGLQRIDALDRDWQGRADKPASDEVTHHTARIRELLGKDFPVIAPFQMADAAELGASLADRIALTRDDPFAATNWLQRLALVRPPLDRLAAVLSAADLLGTVPDDLGLSVAQVAHTPGQRWLALPQQGAKPSAELALVLHSFAPLELAPSNQTLAGFIVDDWSETIPSAEETIAAAFHYDAPAARAPQAILLATPPSLTLPNWTADLLLDVVNEALDLAKLRMIGPEQIDFHGLLLPAIYLPDGFERDVPGLHLRKYKDVAFENMTLHASGKQTIWNSR